MMLQRLALRLAHTAQAQQIRRRCPDRAAPHRLNFCHNDYLGLSQSPDVIQAFTAAAKAYGVGSRASQHVAGYTDIHAECEAAFATFLQRERAMLFSSGFLANLGVIDALTQRGDWVFQDRHNHASLLDGGRLSAATQRRYRHADSGHLAQLLTKTQGDHGLVISDGVFSILGDVAPLDQLAALTQQWQHTLMIDDAHGIGVLGHTGRGSIEHFGLDANQVPILICPLGKAFGVAGAIVAGSTTLIEGLIQYARSAMYTTAPPPAIAAAALASLHSLTTDTWRYQTLQARIHFFRTEAHHRGLHCHPSPSAIQAIHVGDIPTTLATAAALKAQGIDVYPMRPPSVPHQQPVLRLTLNCHHEEQDIRFVLDQLS